MQIDDNELIHSAEELIRLQRLCTLLCRSREAGNESQRQSGQAVARFADALEQVSNKSWRLQLLSSIQKYVEVHIMPSIAG